jgi:hypothetical protein
MVKGLEVILSINTLGYLDFLFTKFKDFLESYRSLKDFRKIKR